MPSSTVEDYLKQLYHEQQAAPERLVPMGRLAAAFDNLAQKSSATLLHRYEMRLHLVYRRALHNLLLLRHAMPNEPSPISGHSAEPEASGPAAWSASQI